MNIGEMILKYVMTPKLSISGDENKRREAAARFDEQEPGEIHREPDCRGHNDCMYPEPHRHGFPCDQNCTECWGLCHPDCPANESIRKQ
ncbi:hypothetical protein PBI_SPORTO_60 [Arthrobacter phage Sporto]|nr:hypothetical protein PBI_SPORTO_60 [Arthrobacter phage Sporto]